MKFRQYARRHWAFIAVCLMFSITAIVVAHGWFRFDINPDASSYFTLARKYAHLDIRHAVSAYWGPLISWLLVPAVWLHADMMMAARVVAILTSLAILITVYKFLLSRQASRVLATLSCLFLGILLLSAAAVESITPDLLIALLVLLFAIQLIRFIRTPTRNQAMLLGAIGAFMYFAKGFGFFLFLAVCGLVGLWQWYNSKKFLNTVSLYIPTLIIFAVLVGPFIAAISLKDHQLTINTAGDFDHALFGPVDKGQSYPMVTMGPLTPPKGAVSVWENPAVLTPLIPAANWSPLQSTNYFHYFVSSVVGRNLNNTVKYLMSYGPYISIGIIAMVVGAIQKNRYRREFVVFSVISVAMILGYSLVLVESRYLLGLVALAVIASSLCVSSMERAKLINQWQVIVGGLLGCAVALLLSLQAIVAVHDPLAKRNLQLLKQARPAITVGTNVISDTFNSYRACYYFDLRCYGVLTPAGDAAIPYYQKLKNENINYLLDFHTRDQDQALQQFIGRYYTKTGEQVVTADGQKLTIYRLN